MRLVIMGIAVIIVSYGPLLAVGLFNPDANPIGLGLLAMAGTFVAATMFILAAIRALWMLFR